MPAPVIPALGWFAAAAFADDPSATAAPPESRLVEARVGVTPGAAPPPKYVALIALVQAKAVGTDLASTNPFLDGQVVGVLGGTNGLTVGTEGVSTYVEQRLSTFLTVTPPTLDGRASLAAAFEVDFAWGDRSYGVGGNTGGAFGADMVNLQTRRFHATLVPLRGRHDLRVHVGLQFVPDGPFDPTTSRPDDLLRSSGRLMIVGSEAAGIAAYGRVGGDAGTRLRYRLGSFTLWESGLADPDDTTLHLADLRFEPDWRAAFGVHAAWIRDRSGGAAGTLGVGPASTLSEMQGGPRLDVRDGATGDAPALDADVVWLSADAGFNHRLDRGPIGASGFVATDVGRLYVDGLDDRSILGWMADGEVRARWAPGDGSVVRAELLATSTDDPADPTYTGAITANSWGVVGALNATHGTVLLMPDPFSIDRYTGVVHDVANGGNGVVAASGSAGFDPIPGRFTTTVGAGWAESRGDTVGTELNAHLVAEPLLFLNLGLHGGVVLGTALPAAPWIVYGSFDWLVFE
ncbi:MAG: hypothetical protein ABMB14_25100 [Myxococcota bacterium]